MSEHLDLDALADVLAGELSSAHLDGCADCQTRLSELAGAMTSVTAALTALPDPVIPPDLVAQIDKALARERRALNAPAAATVTPLATRRSGSRWLLAGGSIAASAALVVGGIVLFSGDSPKSSTTASDQTASIARNATGAAYGRDGQLLAAELPKLLKGNAPAVAGQGAAAAPAAPTGGAEAQTLDSRTAATKPTADPMALLRTPSGLAACLASLSDPSDPGIPLALDYASFEGQPALVVVLPTSTDNRVDVFVVGAMCSQTDSKVLFFTRLTNP